MTQAHSWQNIQGLFVDAFIRKQVSTNTFVYREEPIRRPPRVTYQSALLTASKSMIRFRKPEYLIKMIVRTINSQLDVTHVGILLYDQKRKTYVLIDSKGTKGMKIPVGYLHLRSDNILIKVFTDRKNHILIKKNGALLIDHIQSLLRHRVPESCPVVRENELTAIEQEMKRLRIAVCIPSYFKRKLLGVLLMGPKNNHRPFTKEEIEFFVMLANDTAMALTNAQLIENLQEKIKEVDSLFRGQRKLFISTSIALATAVDARDPHTHGHTERVTHYSLAIAEALEEMLSDNEHHLTQAFYETLHISALLHDIGKIGVPDSILNKTGKLTPEERKKIEEHPIIGASILAPIQELREVIDGVKYHQEHYDGSGYPYGLKGAAIPLIARIITVADAFDAMTTDRPYRQGKEMKLAIREIQENADRQFDPLIVNAFLSAWERGGLMKTHTLNA